MAFVFVGQVNVLAPIVTINFMLTYIGVDYSYFSVSMSYSLQQKSRRTQKETSRSAHCSQPLIFNKPSRYGSDGIVQSRTDGTLLEFTKDMDQLFKPFNKDLGTRKEDEEKDKDVSQKVKPKKIKKPAKQTLQDSFLLDLDRHVSPAHDCDAKSLELSEERQQSFAEQNQPCERSPRLSPARDPKQKCGDELMEYGDELFNEMQDPCNQQVEGKDYKWGDGHLCFHEGMLNNLCPPGAFLQAC